jgi:ribosome-binding protein aMBF1 (putative translation factor)
MKLFGNRDKIVELTKFHMPVIHLLWNPREVDIKPRRLDGANVENTPWLNTLQPLSLACMEIRETFAKNLRRLRQAKGLSQEELAHRADLDRTYISSLERSIYSPSIDVVDRLSTVLGVEAADLLKKSH